MGAPQSPPRPRLGAPQFYSRMFAFLPLSALLSMDGLLRWICAPQSPSALVGLDLRPSISFCTLPSPSALPLPTSHTTSGTPLFLGAHLFPPRIHHSDFQSPFWFTRIWHQFESYRYHKSSQMTLEFNFAHSPGRNHLEIQWVSPASLCHWWIMCSCVCRSWWDGRFSGWHWDYVQLISFRSLSWVIVSVFPTFIFDSLAIFFGSPQYSDTNNRMLMRCWVL